MSQSSRKARRAANIKVPRFRAFLLTGGVAGLLLGVFLGVFGPEHPRYDTSVAAGFLGVLCAALGVLAGGLVAVLLDRRS